MKKLAVEILVFTNINQFRALISAKGLVNVAITAHGVMVCLSAGSIPQSIARSFVKRAQLALAVFVFLHIPLMNFGSLSMA